MSVEIVVTGTPYPIRALDFPLIPGQLWSKRFEFMNPDGVTPLDLTGFTGRGKVTIEDVESADALADITGTLDAIPAEGGITYALSDSESDKLINQGKIVYYWLYRTNASSEEKLLFKGVYNLEA